jgi:protein tyrosine phosphatase (PTP) superfamily phosphohydrolase (DUF442 family)
MSKPLFVTPQLAVGPSPTRKEIEALARKHGIRALLNLNVEGEAGQILSPNVEATWAHTFYLQHERLSLDVEFLDAAFASAFLALVERIAKPVYVHSRKGRRAAALAAIYLAVSRGLPGPEALREARSLGLAGEAVLERFVEVEVERRRALAQIRVS